MPATRKDLPEFTVELQGRLYHVRAEDGAKALEIARKRCLANARRRQRRAYGR